MKKIDRVWDHETTYKQRRAFIEVTLHNSRQPEHLRLTQEVVGKIKQALS